MTRLDTLRAMEFVESLVVACVSRPNAERPPRRLMLLPYPKRASGAKVVRRCAELSDSNLTGIRPHPWMVLQPHSEHLLIKCCGKWGNQLWHSCASHLPHVHSRLLIFFFTPSGGTSATDITFENALTQWWYFSHAFIHILVYECCMVHVCVP